MIRYLEVIILLIRKKLDMKLDFKIYDSIADSQIIKNIWPELLTKSKHSFFLSSDWVFRI